MLTFEEFTAKLVERFVSGKSKEENKLQLGASCQRPNKNFEGFADSVIQMELVETACLQAAYSLKLELAKDQFIQGEGFQIRSSGC